MKTQSLDTVTQEHGAGCAVACVAFLLGVPYQKALKKFAKPEHALARGYYCREIVEVLNGQGLQYTFRKFKQEHQDHLSTAGTIVFLKRSEKHPIGHFVVRSPDGRWMDPWINLPIIAPAESGFHSRLPGKPEYVIHPVVME